MDLVEEARDALEPLVVTYAADDAQQAANYERPILKALSALEALVRAAEPFVRAANSMMPPYGEYIGKDGIRRNVFEEDYVALALAAQAVKGA